MIWVLIYFPNNPPTPPSPSAALSIDGNVTPTVKAPSFLQELLILVKHRSFMILSIVGGYSTGVFGAWSGMFDIILHPLGYSDTLAGWLGFSSTIAGFFPVLSLSNNRDYWRSCFRTTRRHFVS